jgi:phospholipase C
VISPFAKTNYVDHSVTDQTSILRFIEDTFGLGRTGDTSFDNMAGTLANMLELDTGGTTRRLLLDPATGLAQ